MPPLQLVLWSVLLFSYMSWLVSDVAKYSTGIGALSSLVSVVSCRLC